MLVLEINTETKTAEYAQKIGYITWKNAPPKQAGWQDRVFINRFGVHIYIEFKRKGKELRKLQEYRKSQLTYRKCNVYGPVDNFEVAKVILDEYANFDPEAGMDPPRLSSRGYPLDAVTSGDGAIS